MSRTVRDVVLFVAGLMGVGYETVVRADVRAELLMVFAAMLGLPLFLRSDESAREAPPMERRAKPRPKKISLEELVAELEKRSKMVLTSYRRTTAFLASSLVTMLLVAIR